MLHYYDREYFTIRMMQMIEMGQIVSVEGSMATVKIRRGISCDSCTACGMAKDQSEISFRIANDLNAQIGDWVELELESKSLIKASLIVYLLPLIALILGVVGGYAIAGQFSGNPDLYGAIGGILFTALSFLGIRAMDPILRKNGDYSPKMISIVNLHSKGEIMDGE